MTLIERLRLTKPDQPGWWMVERDDGKARPLYLTGPGGAGGWTQDWREGFRFAERENAEQQVELWHCAYGHVRSHGMMVEHYNPDGPEAADTIEAAEAAVALAFDLLEGLKRAYRASGQQDKGDAIAAGYARRTGGIDVPWLIEQLGPASGMEARRAAAENTDAVRDSPTGAAGDAR